MHDSPRKVIEEYLGKTFASLPASKPLLSSAIEVLSLECSQPDGSPVRTGYPMIARLMYKASAIAQDATISLSFYWPSGYLCAQLTTSGRLASLTLPAGTGIVEFFCRSLTMQRGLYCVDVDIERDGEPILQHPPCSRLLEDPGTPALGAFYMEHEAKIV